METVDVVVATFGDRTVWDPLGDRAVLSATSQTHPPDHVFRVHDSLVTDLSSLRNHGAQKSNADWLIFLDADDELDSGYVAAMLASSGDIRQPSTLGVHPDGHEDDYPVLIPPNPGGFLVGNHLVIGCMVRRDIFNYAGGFRAGLTSLEDWDLWIRCLLAGAMLGTAPDAVYRVHVRPASRNAPEGSHHQAYAEIQARYQSRWHLQLTS